MLRTGSTCSRKGRQELLPISLSVERGGSGWHPHHASHGRGLALDVSIHLVLSTCLLLLVFWGVELQGGLKWSFFATPTVPVAT